MKKWTFSIALAGIMATAAQAQTQLSADDYIAKFKDAAISNMVQHKVPASITLAQGLFESGFGNSPLATNANNHFGIKCHDWQGEKYYHDDDAPQECFRKYAKVEDSYADHALFLKGRKRYAKCFELEITDYKGWAVELKAAGYATLPTYAEKIISIIERFKLHEHDQTGLALIKGDKPPVNMAESGQTPEPEKPIKLTEERKPGEAVTVIKTPEIAIEKKPAVSRSMGENNGIPFIITRKGDTQASLALEFDLAEWQIRRYNDLGVNQELIPGMRIYLNPKKENNTEIDSHVVSEGENLYQIAQLHGIKIESLMEMNQLSGQSLSVGQTLKLN